MIQPQWYIRDGTKNLGPFDFARVYELISSGHVSEEAWFGCDDLWMDLDALRQDWPDSRGVLGARTDAKQHSEAPSTLRRAVGEETVPPIPDPAVLDLPDGRTEALHELASRAVVDGFDAPEDLDPVIERDAILILGRRRSGKTVYIATLYSMLWKAVSGLTMKALSGPTHKMLTSVADQLARGQWPEATLGTRQLEFELDHKGRKRLMVAFDYSGEDFKRAFVDDDDESAEVKKLLNYIDRAAAVILLIDPAVAAGGNHEEVVDDDFGMVQAVERIRNWSGGADVPVVLVLTKIDRNKNLIRSHGSAEQFVLRHYPALARTLKRVRIFMVCAVQEARGMDGLALPSKNSVPVNIDEPLRYCLKKLRKREIATERENARLEAENAHREAEHAEILAESAANRRLWIWMTSFIILCLCGLAIFYMVLIS